MNNNRYNPFTGAYVGSTITNEAHVISLISELGIYGFRLNEIPLDSTGGVIVTQTGTGSGDFTEITTGTPAAQQYRIDYGSSSRGSTGIVWCNSANDGDAVDVDYQGGGSIASVENIQSIAGTVNPASIFNAKASLTGTTLTFGQQDTDIPVKLTVPISGTSGQLQEVSISSDLSMTLPSGTFNERILFFTNADGSATLTLSGNASNVVFFWYIVYDSGTPYLGISRSPFHYKMPSNYYHTPSDTGMTRVGAAAPSTWDAMIISKSGALTDTSAPVICVGPLCYGTISGTNGRFSAMALTAGEFPKFNNRKDPYLYDGTNIFHHEQRVDTANGYGSTDTKIRKFTNNPINKGYAIQYLAAGGAAASGSVGGAEFVITETGYYHFLYSENANAAAGHAGLSKNSTQRTTALASNTIGNILGLAALTAADTTGITSINVFLNAGDIIRPHTAGTAAGTTPILLYCAKIGWGPL